MRWFHLLLAVLVVVLGLAFGALNDGDLRVDLYVVQFSLSAGAALLAAALCGALLAGVCLGLAVIWPLRRRLRRALRRSGQGTGRALEPIEQDRA